MKVAVTHDYLNQFGGAERVLGTLLEIFPDADLYTLLYDRDETGGLFENNIKDTSFLDSSLIRNNHRMFIPFMPFASERITSDKEYDLVFSSTAGYAKGFGVKSKYHISYCHSPLRYAWEFNEMGDFDNAPWPLRKFAEPVAEALRRWDKKASQNVNLFIANSNFISNKINSYYNRSARVIYPPVDSNTFYLDEHTLETDGDYYLMVGRLLYYKLFDLGIEAFNKLDKPLKIVGSGPEEEIFKEKAGDNIEFVSHVSDRNLRVIYNNAKALIFPQVEDFGLVAAEAQMCGVPIISYNKGGGREIVEDNKTGLLFDNQSSEAIVKSVRKAEKMDFDRKYIAKRAEMFSKNRFKKEVERIIKESGFEL